jgi:hypothetical protein
MQPLTKMQPGQGKNGRRPATVRQILNITKTLTIGLGAKHKVA